jgi:hypothetical protein
MSNDEAAPLTRFRKSAKPSVKSDNGRSDRKPKSKLNPGRVRYCIKTQYPAGAFRVLDILIGRTVEMTTEDKVVVLGTLHAVIGEMVAAKDFEQPFLDRAWARVVEQVNGKLSKLYKPLPIPTVVEVTPNVEI